MSEAFWCLVSLSSTLSLWFVVRRNSEWRSEYLKLGQEVLYWRHQCARARDGREPQSLTQFQSSLRRQS